MASIEPYDTAGGRRWRVRYRKPGGRQSDKRGFPTKRAAQAWLHETEVDKRAGRFVDPTLGKVTVGVVGEHWLASKADLEKSSRARCERSLRLQVLPEWEHAALVDVTARDVQCWIGAMAAAELSPSQISKAHGTLAQILDMAVRDRMIPHNVARDGVNLPKPRATEPIFLNVDQLWQLARAAGRGHDVVLTLGYTGLRWGEMAGLKSKRWDSARRRLRVVESATEVDGGIDWTDTKTHKARTIVVPDFIAELIDERVRNTGIDDLIFPAANGSPLRNGNARRDWFDDAVLATFPPKVMPKPGEVDENGRKVTPKPSVAVTPHDLRHTAASLAISAGANIKAVQRMLGHATASMTLDLYGHLYEDDLDGVATALSAMRPKPKAM